MFLEKRAKWPCFDCTMSLCPKHTGVCGAAFSWLSCTGMFDPVLSPAPFAERRNRSVQGALAWKYPFFSFLSFPLCLSLSVTGVVQSSQAQDAALALAGYQVHTGDAGTSSSQQTCCKPAGGGGLWEGGLIQQTFPQ